MNRIVLMLAVIGSLSACALAPAPASDSRLPDSTEANSNTVPTGAGARLPAETGPGSDSRLVSNATRALLTQSQAEREDGNLGGAAATIERGLSISPDDALLWVELGEIRMAQGDAQLAEEMARKALTLTDRNSTVAARARRLISD